MGAPDTSWVDLRIETARLLLRPPRAEDFDGWAANMADAESARYIGGQQPRVAYKTFMELAGGGAA